MGVDCSCKTYEFNFRGICAGYDCVYKYGENITDELLTGDGWNIGLEYFIEIQKLSPWYIQEKFDRCKISLHEFLNEMDKYYNDEPIAISLYEVIERVYGLNVVELSKILDVPVGVMGYARNRGTIAKRAKQFSDKLYIPVEYFEEITQLDIQEIEMCKLKYNNLHK